MQSGVIGSVGAVDDRGVVLGHMAMTVHEGASVVELGNTVVDPAARGEGLAWKVGAELSAWCRELGYQGFLHYPTTDHHIMQRQSVKAGFEIGLMLGYIPADTHGKVSDRRSGLRQAATIVYEPYRPGADASGFAPAAYLDILNELAALTGLKRDLRVADAPIDVPGEAVIRVFPRRGLQRLQVVRGWPYPGRVTGPARIGRGALSADRPAAHRSGSGRRGPSCPGGRLSFLRLAAGFFRR